MNTKFLILVGFLAFAAADTRPLYTNEISEESSSESHESGEAKYSFNWVVSDDSSSNEFGHQETRDGDNTQGSYFVHLPDGRLQKVTYYVDGDSGYVADVSFEGEAQFPDDEESDESSSEESDEDGDEDEDDEEDKEENENEEENEEIEES